MSRLMVILSVVLLLAGCKKEDILSKQQESFVKYLGSTHSPKLLSQAEREEQQDFRSPHYTTYGETVYRYIRDENNEERDEQPEVEYGDLVTLTFRMYVFDFRNIAFEGATITMPYFSNDPTLEEAYQDAGMATDAWNFEPLEVILGRSEILKGIEYALPGCRQGDVVEVYMTYNMAYGRSAMGVVPIESPVAVLLSVDNVIKIER